MQPERQSGNAAAKRKCWSRKRIQGMDVHESVRAQKKSFQRKVRNGKIEELPTRQRSAYKKVINQDYWELAGAKLVIVDGETIKEDTYYRCVDGEVVEAD